MSRTLLLTNDFPPRPGGIQSYLQNLVDLLPPEDVVVYAPRWRGDSHEKFDAAAPYRVYRHPTTLMLPTPFVARRAAEIVRREQISTVWFGAAAPLAVLAPALRRAGAQRIIASTHGHEVGRPGPGSMAHMHSRSSSPKNSAPRYAGGKLPAAG